jgi:fructose-1,6-bisphosphatase/inositol monophosphatase family enzyme
MKRNRLERLADIAFHLMNEAADYTVEKFGQVAVSFKEFDVGDVKGAKPYIARAVSDVDKDTQSLILSGLISKGLHRGIDLHAEEDTPEVDRFEAGATYRWVLDSLDGTSNYIMAFPGAKEDLKGRFGVNFDRDPHIYGLSLGLQYVGPELSDAEKARSNFVLVPGTFLFSIVILPNPGEEREIYIAKQGLGVTLNGEPLLITDRSCYKPRSDVVLVNSKADFAKHCFPEWKQPVCTVYAMTGVASGKHAAYFARNTYVHDFGPSLLVVSEAGGYSSNERGEKVNPLEVNYNIMKFLVSGRTPEFNEEIIRAVRTHHPRFERMKK